MNKSTVNTCLAILTLMLSSSIQAQPGPYISGAGWSQFGGPSYAASAPKVGAFYFGWNSQPAAGAAMIDPYTLHPDVATPHPLNGTGADAYRNRPSATFSNDPVMDEFSPDWHGRNLTQQISCGVDFAIVNYQPWLNNGSHGRNKVNAKIDAINFALTSKSNLGQPSPYVAMFLDTLPLGKALQNVRLSSSTGRQLLWESVRDFYSRVNPAYWFRINGRPVIWLWVEDALVDPKGTSLKPTFNAMSDNFARNFGGVRPYIVANAAWRTQFGLDPFMTYVWGASNKASGCTIGEGISSVGPGCDSTAIHYITGHPLGFRSREGGALYRRGWQQARASGNKTIVVETWDEFAEGSAVAPSYELGYQYWDLTRRQSAAFTGRALREYYSPYTNEWYTKIDMPGVNWIEAQRAARDMTRDGHAGSLLSLESFGEADFVDRAFGNSPGTWLGGYWGAGQWNWESGDLMNRYTSWYPGFPDAGSGCTLTVHGNNWVNASPYYRGGTGFLVEFP